ncbi:Ppx/GppA phosphatase family protein [Saxibacter everestensis]|uniref:Ppx/GppA phosphatase family protein n=1 Tax=Saxibacter everestensis TaxID=2909229 RepID=A0ABY8QP78_9MICO|nr:Ppx/GppA phosphatase family protein [Brevibacteriaceae bacterium ZFBP1038]
MTRVAAFDCGTNSLRLLIADIRPGQDVVELDRQMRVVRLGQGVDATGGFVPEALERTFAATEEYAALAKEHDVQKMRFVATSATRDANNREEFLTGIVKRLGIEPEVISGDEEAQLSFLGATLGLQPRAQGSEKNSDTGSHQGAEVPPPYLVVDLGGGSTELVLGDNDGVISSFSMDIGCVRMTERHLRSDPPTEAEIAAATADIDAALDEAALTVDISRAQTLVGVAGTITTVTAHALGLDHYDRSRIHGASLLAPQVLDACSDLLQMPRDERAALPYMHPGRVDVIGGGALVWQRIVSRVTGQTGITNVVASEEDILDGIAWNLVVG